MGYRDSGSVPHTFLLREEPNVDVRILNLLLSRKQVDLLDVAEYYPFFSIGSRSTTPAKVKGHQITLPLGHHPNSYGSAKCRRDFLKNLLCLFPATLPAP